MGKRRLFIEASSIVPTKRSGIGHFTLELLKELDKKQYGKIEVVAFGCMGERPGLEQHGFKRIKLVILPFPHKVLAVLSRFSFKFPIDGILGRGTYLFPNFRNLYVARSKSLTYVHDVSFKLFPEFTQSDNLRYILANIDKWIKRTDVVMTISEQSKREIISELGVPESKIVVTPLAVNPDVFNPRPENEVGRACERLGVMPGSYFLFVGNIEPRKNLEFLVRTYSNNLKLKKYPLVIIGGDGWLNESINQSITQAVSDGYKIVRNQSYVPDEELPALMTGAIGLVMPSHHEGFGLPVIQALACGTPVAVSDIPVMHETAGKNAYYYGPEDSAALNRALEAVIAGPKRVPHVKRSWASIAKEVIKLTT